MSSLSTDPYKALGIERNADSSTIKSAYRKLVLKCHPDKVQDPALKAIKQDEFQRVQQAYEILGDEKKRQEYDEDSNLKRLRDELSRGMTRSAATSRSSTKTYSGPHIRTAEPPHSFKPSPPPTSPFRAYGNADHQYSHSWDNDVPLRSKHGEGHSARGATNYQKSREDIQGEERRRRKDDDGPPPDWMRDKERDHDRERERERDKERERKSRDDRKEKIKREMDKREKDRDRARRQEQQEKHRSRKPYVEPYEDSGDDCRVPKKASAGISTASTANNGGKRHVDNPRRDKPTRRDDSPKAGGIPDKTSEKMKQATDYMVSMRRRESKSGGSSNFPDTIVYNANYPDPEQSWHINDSPRPRRSSQDDKKLRTRMDPSDDAANDFQASATFRPRLQKSSTSPPGVPLMSKSSAACIPSISRSATMGSPRHLPPAAPTAPSPESSRHSKPERRRREVIDHYTDNDGIHPWHLEGQPREQRFDGAPLPSRATKISQFRSWEGSQYHHLPPDESRRSGFSKVKMSPKFSPDQVYQSKLISDDDIAYSDVRRAPFLNVGS